MTKIVWAPSDGSEVIGAVGSLRYIVRAPDRTPGWRVWCRFNDPHASTGSIIVSMKAPDLEAAKYAAECHFRSFVAELIGDQGVLNLMAENERLRRAVQFYADEKNYVDATWDCDPDVVTPHSIPMLCNGDGSSYCDCGDTARAALKPSTPDTPAA